MSGSEPDTTTGAAATPKAGANGHDAPADAGGSTGSAEMAALMLDEDGKPTGRDRKSLSSGGAEPPADPAKKPTAVAEALLAVVQQIKDHNEGFKHDYTAVINGGPECAEVREPFRNKAGTGRVIIRLTVEAEKKASRAKPTPQAPGKVPAPAAVSVEQQAVALADTVSSILASRMSDLTAGIQRIEAAVKVVADRPPAQAAAGPDPDVVLAEVIPAEPKSDAGPRDDAPTGRAPADDTDGSRPKTRDRRPWLGYAPVAVAVLNLILLAAVLAWILTRPSPSTAPALGDEFAERIAAKVTVPRPNTEVLNRIEQGVNRLQSSKTDKTEPPTPTPPPPVLSPEEKQKLLDAVRAAAAPAKAGGPAAVPADVFVVVTHGATMDARPYTDPLRDVVKDFRAKDGAVRVGLALGQGEEVVPLVPVEAPAAKLDAVGEPNPDHAENPALLGGKVKNAFKENRPRQRAVLVVSAACDPVKANAPGWNTLSDVHVVVVARREVGGADRDRLARWFEFAEATRGTIHLIAHHDNADRQKAELEKCLRRLVTMPYSSGGP